MSGLVSLIQRGLASSSTDDEVSIVVGGTRLQGWQSSTISKSCESLPNSWAVTASTQFMQGPALAATRPGQACTIYIGDDLVITGWIDRRTITAGPRNHDVLLSGRGLTRNLVDCSADLVKDPGLRGGMITAKNTLDLAQRLSKAYNVTCISAVADLGIAIPNFQIGLGETPYQIIESAARYAGFLVYENEKGQLVLDRLGTKHHASGFAMPGNIENIHANRSVDQRFSFYQVVWFSTAGLTELGTLINDRAHAEDKTMTEYRLKIIVSEQLTPAFDVGEARAKWEMARRIGRSQAATISCDSWRDVSGKLWTPNQLATVDAPAADIEGAVWAIGGVTFRKDQGGTHADLVLMPKEAFMPQPNPLNLFDAELSQKPAAASSPAPPSSNGPGLG